MRVQAPMSEQVREYRTRSGAVPPPAGSTFIVVDEGNASPRFMRLTVNQLANSVELYNRSHIPLALVLQPMAEISPAEARQRPAYGRRCF